MLKRRALLATLWSGADVLLRHGLQFGTLVVLARLLLPQDFGAMALLSLFSGVAMVIVDSGFSAALIQRHASTHIEESTVFWINIALGVVTAALLGLMGPWIAAFYALPVLRPLSIVIGCNVFIGSLGAIHSTLLSKRLDFRTQLRISAFSTLGAGTISILLAWRGFGVWALAAQIVCATLIGTALLWHLNSWRPTFGFRWSAARSMARFGGFHFASTLLDIMYSRLYTLLIGKIYGTRELGYYNNADSTRMMPSGFLAAVMNRAAFPLFSASHDDKARLRRGVQLSIRGMMLLNAPALLGMAALSDSLIVILFGQAWAPAAPILQVLCLAGVLLPAHSINLQVLMAQGHSDRMFRVEIAKKSVGLTLIAIGACFGVLGIAWSQVALSLIGLAFNAYYSGVLLEYGFAAQIRDLSPCVGLATGMAGIIYLAKPFVNLSPIGQVAIFGVAGAVFYFSLALLLRLDAIRDVVALFRPDSNVPVDAAGMA